jgi:putative endonuclease
MVNMEASKWYVYLVKCIDDSLYCGISTDVNKRILLHNSGRGAKYTRGRTPVKLLETAGPMSHRMALHCECMVKKQPKIFKERYMRMLSVVADAINKSK